MTIDNHSMSRETATIGNVLFAEMPCKNHRPNQLSYYAWHDYACKMYRQGKTQTQCNKCGRWYFNSEM